MLPSITTLSEMTAKISHPKWSVTLTRERPIRFEGTFLSLAQTQTLTHKPKHNTLFFLFIVVLSLHLLLLPSTFFLLLILLLLLYFNRFRSWLESHEHLPGE